MVGTFQNEFICISRGPEALSQSSHSLRAVRDFGLSRNLVLGTWSKENRGHSRISSELRLWWWERLLYQGRLRQMFVCLEYAVDGLTHWGWDKMAAISQTTFSNAFSWRKNVRISFKISLKFVPKGPINNIPALVQIIAWWQPLSESMVVRSLTHVCVTQPQWVKECI